MASSRTAAQPLPTGEIADGRWLAERLALALGQPVVVGTKPGAGGNIGMAEVARSAPDGYTIAIEAATAG